MLYFCKLHFQTVHNNYPDRYKIKHFRSYERPTNSTHHKIGVSSQWVYPK